MIRYEHHTDCRLQEKSHDNKMSRYAVLLLFSIIPVCACVLTTSLNGIWTVTENEGMFLFLLMNIVGGLQCALHIQCTSLLVSVQDCWG